MKKILDNFYIISKLSFSFILLICLIGVLYILYINYKNENIISTSQYNFEQEIKKDIEKNSKLIEKIVVEIKQNESILSEIKNNIDLLSKQNKDNNTSSLNKSIELLNNNFDLLSNEIKDLKKNKTNTSLTKNKEQLDLIDSNKNEIIDLILIKYENNLMFDQELNYLKKIINSDKSTYIEKIAILSTKPYKGHEYLKIKFNEEVNSYLKKIINTNPESLFSKIILPYLEISPTSENKISNDLILKIKETKLHLENKNIENALVNLKNIDNYENIFEETYLEINKYLIFKKELLSLK